MLVLTRNADKSVPSPSSKSIKPGPKVSPNRLATDGCTTSASTNNTVRSSSVAIDMARLIAV